MRSAFLSASLRRALARAASLVAGNRRLGRLLSAAAAAVQARRSPLGSAWRDAQAFVRMAKEVAAGRYRALPTRSLVAVLAALLYFLDPLDVVPDFVPVIGFVDDAAVLLWVASRVRRDLDAFVQWEEGQGTVIDVEPVAASSTAIRTT